MRWVAWGRCGDYSHARAVPDGTPTGIDVPLPMPPSKAHQATEALDTQIKFC